MWDYFWAGLLAGLGVWIVSEVFFRLFRSAPLRRAGAALAVLIPADEKTENLEYLLRRAERVLSDGDLTAGRIFVADRGMDVSSRQIAVRFGGVRLCTEKELGPAIAGLLPAKE